jgi:hypothetical protein
MNSNKEENSVARDSMHSTLDSKLNNTFGNPVENAPNIIFPNKIDCKTKNVDEEVQVDSNDQTN